MLTKQGLLEQIKEINTDASCYAINGDIDSFNRLAYGCSYLMHEDYYNEVLTAFRLSNTPFQMAGYSFIDEDLLDQSWGRYEPYRGCLGLMDDLVICNISWKEFMHMYGYANEYEALNDTDPEKQIYNCTAQKRIELIEEYTRLYRRLYLSPNDLFTIHKTSRSTRAVQKRFIENVCRLIDQRERFFSYINYELVGEDVESLNRTLKNKKTNKERFDYLKSITGNIYDTLKSDPSVDFRDYFIIKDNRKVKCSSYLNAKGLSRTAYFRYRNADSFYKGSLFYLELAFFLGIPSSNEVEKFLNYHGCSLQSPYNVFTNISGVDVFDYDICRWIDAGIDYNLINTMLGFEFQTAQKK